MASDVPSLFHPLVNVTNNLIITALTLRVCALRDEQLALGCSFLPSRSDIGETTRVHNTCAASELADQCI